ncbi:MAG: trehalose-6-phosphate synthase [Parvibaculaceae bacterium]
MKRLVVVSNRVSSFDKAAKAGGLAVAVGDTLKRSGGLWFGWNGDIAEEAGPETLKIRRTSQAQFATMPLTPKEHEAYYLGYANKVLWPVLHNRLDLAEFEGGFFDTYCDVNRKFAETLGPLLGPDDQVWIHDYHLIPLARELRRLGVESSLGFFLHIPFPPSEVFAAIPEHANLGEALMTHDLVGFQSENDLSNFHDYVRKLGRGWIGSDGLFHAFRQTASARSFPISIDVQGFAEEAANVDSEREAAKLRLKDNEISIIGVDRLDYTKGLPQRFRAFGKFLDRHPERRGQVSLVQIAPPSREDLPAYVSIRKELERLSGAVNGAYGDVGWVPIRYIRRSLPRNSLAGLFRASRVGLVTPLRDGMNLVAKEYVAAQDPEDPGVLILSRFAGAAEEMKEALIVNPHDVENLCEAIAEAVAMPLEERKARHGALMSRLETNDVHRWAANFLAALQRASDARLALEGVDPQSRSMESPAASA